MNIAGETITNSGSQSSQVQSDWAQATTTALDYIKNKPTIPAAQIASDWTQATTTALDYIKNKPVLAAVATSGSYVDLTNKPTAILTYNIPNTLVGAKWYRLGTFTAGQNGKSIKVSITTTSGYNALITQPSITTLFFSTSNSSSLDPAGFAAVGTHYRTGRGNTVTSVKWVGNAGGISATSYDLNVSFSGFSGESSFYSVECGAATTWTHNASIVSVTDPGVASTTVGISTEELYVPTSGTFSATPAASANVLTIIGSSTTGNVVQFSNTVADGTFIMTSTGKIGIGMVNPTYALDVTDQSNGILRLTQYNNTDGAVIRAHRAKGTLSAPSNLAANDTLTALRGFGYNTTTGFSGRCVGIEMVAAEAFTPTATGTYMGFHTCAPGTTTNSEKVRILGNGNVGIGTTGPAYKLIVDNTTGTGTGPAALIQASGITGGQNMSLILGKTNTTRNAATILWNHAGDDLATNYLGLGYWGGDNVLNVTASSNVGIGTSSPSAKFHVVGTSASHQTARFVSPAGQNCYLFIDTTDAAQQAALQFNRAGTVQWINYVPGSSTDMKWYNGTADRMTLTTAGALTCSNDITAFSDIRHKTNLKKIPDALDKVSALNGYTFNRTDEEDKERRYAGVVAQEVLEVLPEIVHKNSDGIYSVAYGNLTALLIEALKEERKKREDLEARVAKLETNSTPYI